jgi:thiol-disulfide isomerase/thioredoxin
VSFPRAAGLAVLLSGVALAATGDIVVAVRTASDARNFALADREIQSYRSTLGVTPELLEALSWLARGTLDAKQYDRADGYATETWKLSLEMLKRGGPAPASLGTALGAAIEVHAQVLAARGERPEAIAYLKTELATWHETPLAPRIQKNINLLTLEGKPAPALDATHWLGDRQTSLAALKGHPVLLFFWAHWCSDCKAEAPILARLMATYGPKGLVLVAPTQLYGYTAAGEVAPDAENRYIGEVWRQFYGVLGNVPVPVSAQNFQRYGCSTTPTIVLLDRGGVVRLYHPGAMTYDALASKIQTSLTRVAVTTRQSAPGHSAPR